jgi:hypothetical protein
MLVDTNIGASSPIMPIVTSTHQHTMHHAGWMMGGKEPF